MVFIDLFMCFKQFFCAANPVATMSRDLYRRSDFSRENTVSDGSVFVDSAIRG